MTTEDENKCYEYLQLQQFYNESGPELTAATAIVPWSSLVMITTEAFLGPGLDEHTYGLIITDS